MDSQVTLPQMLEARERRVLHQQELTARFSRPVVCFTMNIAGPVKDSPLIRRAFLEGVSRLRVSMAKLNILHDEAVCLHTGCEGYFCADASAEELKRICTAIEDGSAMGRLYDIDVLREDGTKVERETVSGGERNCIVCGAKGRGCASRRVHTVEQLQQATRQILEDSFRILDRKRIASLAARSLLEEVCVTPKPGLVDRENNGSHADMDIFTFMASAAALHPYFETCVRTGQETAGEDPKETFRLLRAEGIAAEQEMLLATGGINTHKGAVFTMGILCGAAGRLWNADSFLPDAGRICAECAAMTREAMEKDFSAAASAEHPTAGQRLFLEKGLRGIRGEMADGLPSVLSALSRLEAQMEQEMNLNDAGMVSLLHLIASVGDTNIAARGGMEKAEAAQKQVRELLEAEPVPSAQHVRELDLLWQKDRLSPGGCADLLAAAFFLRHLKESEK